MNTEHLLDAIGLLDDDLVREAEEYKSLRKGPGYWRWGLQKGPVLGRRQRRGQHRCQRTGQQ